MWLRSVPECWFKSTCGYYTCTPKPWTHRCRCCVFQSWQPLSRCRRLHVGRQEQILFLPRVDEKEQGLHPQAHSKRSMNQGPEPLLSHYRCRAVLPSPSQESMMSSLLLSQPSDQSMCPPSSSSGALTDSQDQSRFLKSSSRPAVFIVFALRP